MPEKNYDIIIMGSGPGGYIAAIRAAQLGFKTLVVENEGIGGTCLNWGCIATKALLASGDMLQNIKNAEKYGIKIENYTYDFHMVIERSRKIVARMALGIKYLFKKNNIDFIEGFARIDGKGKVLVKLKNNENKLFFANNIIIATGAKPAVIKGMEPDGNLILNSRQALLSQDLPETLLIVGAGAIGLEFASLYNAFGTKVTLVEMTENIAPTADKEIALIAQNAFIKQGIKILNKTSVQKITKNQNTLNVTLALEKGIENYSFSKAIVAVGISPNVENIGLDTVGITLEKGHIPVNQWLQTQVNGIYAIGDVVAPPWLGHKASAEAIVCVEKIAQKKVNPVQKEKIPFCIYSSPQIAGFGITQEKAEKEKLNVNIGHFPMMANGKAQTSGHTEGMAKVIIDKNNDEILGAWLVGENVTELINAIIPGKPLDKIFPHPTLSEVIPEAILDAFGRALNI